jgi:hypothetical protein
VTGTAPTAASPAHPSGDRPQSDVVFDVNHVTLRFGGVTSLNDVTMQP